MFALCVLALAAPAFHSLIGLGTGMMYLAPALVLMLPLFAGRYIGERRLLELAPRMAPARRRPRTRVRPPALFEPILARGGELIASSLAERPPPAFASC